MKAKSIILGTTYHITLGRNEVLGEVVEETETGWNVRLTASDKVIKVNNPDRFIRKARMIPTTQNEVVVETQAQDVIEPEKPQREEGISAINAAHRVLVEIGTPLNVRQIAEAAIERGYCPNLKGKTPQATISSALQRDITRKGSASRFYKAGKGQYAAVECRSE